LVVLSNDLRGPTGEIQGEGSLVGTKVVDVEDKFFRKVFWITPDNPADAGVDETVFVT
jgi:hypothetical protein